MMLSSAVRSYTDVESYAKALPHNTIELHVTAPGEFKASTTLIALHNLGVQRFADNLPRVAHAALPPGRAIISFRTERGPDLFWGGLQMLPTAIFWHSNGSCCFQRSSGSASWGSMSLPIEMWCETLATLAGRDLASPRQPITLVPSPAAMANLQRLHAACCGLAVDAPEILTNPEAARGIEQALIGAMADCLGGASGPKERRGNRLHSSVMGRFRALVEENADRALYMAEISAAIGVSGRTLRSCCSEHLGMGASQYLILRRLHLAHRALRQSASHATTVTEAATRYGFWELGRFSVRYKSLFGEMPSQTLRRESGSAEHADC
jgi:AraC-like DNA-binding protein